MLYKYCPHYDDDLEALTAYCKNCKHYEKCLFDRKGTGEQYRYYEPRNAIVNIFGENKMEVIVHKREFRWLEDNANLEGQTIDRKFLRYDCSVLGEVLIPKDEKTRLNDLYETLEDSSLRAQDKFYGYAFANEWKYFFTFTFDPKKVNRYDDDAIMHLWGMFRKRLKRFDPDIKIICMKERHKDGALHFHGLINTEKDFLLKPHLDKSGKWVHSSSGAPLFEFDFWNYGLHTLAVLPKEQNYEAAVNYMTKYVTKQCDAGYGQERYFHTRNLAYKESFVTNEADTAELLTSADFKLYKEDDNIKVYRTFNVK